MLFIYDRTYLVYGHFEWITHSSIGNPESVVSPLSNSEYLQGQTSKVWSVAIIRIKMPCNFLHQFRISITILYVLEPLFDKLFWIPGQIQNTCTIVHGEEHVKKLFSTAVIVNEYTHSNLVRGHCFTGEDTNIFHPWSLKLEWFFRKSTNILFYMVTNLFIYTTGSSHIIDDCSRAVCFCQSLIGL